MKSQAAPPTAARAISFKNMAGKELFTQTVGLLQGRSSFKQGHECGSAPGAQTGCRRRSQEASDQAQWLYRLAIWCMQ